MLEEVLPKLTEPPLVLSKVFTVSTCTLYSILSEPPPQLSVPVKFKVGVVSVVVAASFGEFKTTVGEEVPGEGEGLTEGEAEEEVSTIVSCGVTLLVIVQSGEVSLNSITSPLETSDEIICKPHSVSEQPEAAISLALPPEDPSSVCPAPVVSKVPVPDNRLVQLPPLVSDAAATALTMVEVVVISCQVPPFFRHWNIASVLPAAVPPVSCSLKRKRKTVSTGIKPALGLASSFAHQVCVFSAPSSFPKR